jgi:hypothetical protein
MLAGSQEFSWQQPELLSSMALAPRNSRKRLLRELRSSGCCQKQALSEPGQPSSQNPFFFAVWAPVSPLRPCKTANGNRTSQQSFSTMMARNNSGRSGGRGNGGRGAGRGRGGGNNAAPSPRRRVVDDSFVSVVAPPAPRQK